jgi:hypothetical protein
VTIPVPRSKTVLLAGDLIKNHAALGLNTPSGAAIQMINTIQTSSNATDIPLFINTPEYDSEKTFGLKKVEK